MMQYIQRLTVHACSLYVIITISMSSWTYLGNKFPMISVAFTSRNGRTLNEAANDGQKQQK